MTSIDEEEDNPWSVGNLNHFLYYCCPECDERNQSQDLFLQHALGEHPKARQYFEKLKVKNEPIDENCLDIKLIESEKIFNSYYNTENDIITDDDLEYYSEMIKSENEEDIIKKENDENFPNCSSTNFDEDISEEKLNNKSVKSHNCDFCGNTFGYQVSLIKHIKKFHDGVKNNECKPCGKSFFTKEGLSNHENKVHTGLKDHNCDICGSGFSSKSYLKHHIISAHEGIKRFSCEFCEKTFVGGTGLTNHVKAVHEGIKYECDVCGSSFTQSDSLKRHFKKSHEYEDLIRCEEYLKEMTRKRKEKRKSQKKTSSSIKKVKKEKEVHVCAICNKSFASSKNLTTHVKSVHEGLREFQCDSCGKAFTTKGKHSIFVAASRHDVTSRHGVTSRCHVKTMDSYFATL